MTTKLNPFAAAPQVMKSWAKASMDVAGSLDPGLVALVEIRASQINGCANCINMHTVDARAKGETGPCLSSGWRASHRNRLRHKTATTGTPSVTADARTANTTPGATFARRPAS